jgi:DNA-directed RNA polymerase specialized sigma24 family protein
MEEKILTSIDKKLDAVLRLMANKSIEGKNKTEAIMTLGALGLDANLISEIVNTTPGTVYARLAEAKRKSKKKVKSNE